MEWMQHWSSWDTIKEYNCTIGGLKFNVNDRTSWYAHENKLAHRMWESGFTRANGWHEVPLASGFHSETWTSILICFTTIAQTLDFFFNTYLAWIWSLDISTCEVSSKIAKCDRLKCTLEFVGILYVGQSNIVPCFLEGTLLICSSFHSLLLVVQAIN